MHIVHVQASASHHWPPPSSTLLHLGLVHVNPSFTPFKTGNLISYGEVLGHPYYIRFPQFPHFLKIFLCHSLPFSFWFGFLFLLKKNFSPSLSQSSPYPHYVLPSPEGSNIPFFLSSLQSRALSSSEAFLDSEILQATVSFLSFLIWFLPSPSPF